jgi:hypothetical protein
MAVALIAMPESFGPAPEASSTAATAPGVMAEAPGTTDQAVWITPPRIDLREVLWHGRPARGAPASAWVARAARPWCSSICVGGTGGPPVVLPHLRGWHGRPAHGAPASTGGSPVVFPAILAALPWLSRHHGRAARATSGNLRVKLRTSQRGRGMTTCGSAGFAGGNDPGARFWRRWRARLVQPVRRLWPDSTYRQGDGPRLAISRNTQVNRDDAMNATDFTVHLATY